MIDIQLMNVQVLVGTAPNGMARILQFIDPTGIRVTVPLDMEAAKAIGLQLTSSVLVAQGPLPMPPKKDMN